MQREETLTASGLDRIIETVFAVGDPVVFEAYSEFDCDILSFQNAEDLIRHMEGSRSNSRGFFGFAVHFPSVGGFVQKRRIELDRRACGGHVYRYCMEGWGVIQLQINLQKMPKVRCRVAVNTEKRAIACFPVYPELESPDLWDWKAVEKHAGRLIRELRKHAQ